MARNGTGIYSLPSGNPVVSGTTISVTWANNTLNDIASALTQSVSKDGQTVMTGHQNFGGFKITNLASGTISGDAVHFGQLALKLDATGGSVSNLTVSDGTANGVPYLNASKVLTSGAALTFDGANLGLGVVPSAWGASTWRAIDFQNATGGSGIGALYPFVAANAYQNGTNWVYKTTAAASYTIQGNGAHQWFTAPSGTAGGAITFTQAMTLDASGNLLVRQTSSGNLNSRGFYADSSGYFGQNHQSGDASGSVYTYFGYNGATVGTITQYGTTGISLNSASTLAFQNGAGTLDTSGNLAVTGAVTGTNLYAQSQTWQNVTGSRAIGTSYTNSTARPIEVQTSVASAGGTVNFYMNMNGTYIRVGVAVAGSSECAITVTVPPGQTYGVSTANGSMSSAGAGALAGWNELR